MADLLLVGAYGRDYKSLAAAKADWEADKDFTVVASGQKVNKSDWDQFGDGSQVWVRFKALTEKGQLA